MGDKIDFNLLANIMNPAIFVMLLGGLFLGINTTQLIMIGVVGYGLCFLFHRIGKNQAGAASSKKSKKR